MAEIKIYTVVAFDTNTKKVLGIHNYNGYNQMEKELPLIYPHLFGEIYDLEYFSHYQYQGIKYKLTYVSLNYD